jgi:hypothetical protein
MAAKVAGLKPAKFKPSSTVKTSHNASGALRAA